MVACRDLGYLDDIHEIWDCTYGNGAFWNLWEPLKLLGTDLSPTLTPSVPVDFTDSGFADRQFYSVVFDPPYKLNGTPDVVVDLPYGVHVATRWQDRLDLIRRGMVECARVLGDGYLLVKCMDQVSSGKVRWQTTLIIEWAEVEGLSLVDRLDMPSYRAQPSGVRQVHARRNTSTVLVFRRGHKWRP